MRWHSVLTVCAALTGSLKLASSSTTQPGRDASTVPWSPAAGLATPHGSPAPDGRPTPVFVADPMSLLRAFPAVALALVDRLVALSSNRPTLPPGPLPSVRVYQNRAAAPAQAGHWCTVISNFRTVMPPVFPQIPAAAASVQPGIIVSCQSPPDSVSSVPDSVSSVPDSVSSVPDSVSSVSDSVSSVPDSVTSVPDSVSSVPDDVNSVPDSVTSVPDVDRSDPATTTVHVAEKPSSQRQPAAIAQSPAKLMSLFVPSLASGPAIKPNKFPKLFRKADQSSKENEIAFRGLNAI